MVIGWCGKGSNAATLRGRARGNHSNAVDSVSRGDIRACIERNEMVGKFWHDNVCKMLS